MTAKPFTPIEDELRDVAMRSRPVEWYVLIRDMELLRRETGWGLALTWGIVHRGEYDAARSHVDELLQDHAMGRFAGPRPKRTARQYADTYPAAPAARMEAT